MSSAEKVRKYRLNQAKLGRLKRDMYLTDYEFKELKLLLSRLRNQQGVCNDS